MIIGRLSQHFVSVVPRWVYGMDPHYPHCCETINLSV